MKNLSNLTGVQTLNRKEQRKVFGGCAPDEDCGDDDEGGSGGWYCGCTNGPNVPSARCNVYWCHFSCSAHNSGTWNNVCIDVG
tara:strand:+ start:25925 stop:26173 length:249 start_codon:yes stop_codon:yes gene_type:complete